MVIALDLDEVAFNYIDPFIEFVNKKRGTNFSRSDMETYSFEKAGVIPVGTNDVWCGEFGDAGNLVNLPLMNDAQYYIQKLKEKHTVFYLTSRPIKYAVDTQMSLDAADISGPVYYSTKKITKADIVKEMHADVFVDDSPRYVNEVHKETNAKCILFSEISGSIEECEAQVATCWEEIFELIEKQ